MSRNCIGLTGVAFPFVLLCVSTEAAAMAAPQQRPFKLEHLSSDDVLAIASHLVDAGRYDEAQVLLDRLSKDGAGGAERDFLDGMIALARKDYGRAEGLFRKMLDRVPSLLRVRLELARTLFFAKKDEQADYQFGLAIAEHPPAAVRANIARFRESIRARRAWRFNVRVGIAPDSNINSATSKDTIDLYGLPFDLDDSAKARSGIGMMAGGDASVRLWRSGKVPVYVAAYGQWNRYKDHDFDDIFVGGEAGPEFHLGEGRLRTTATAYRRWYGGQKLVTELGGKLNYEKVIGGKWAIEGSLGLRHDEYAGRNDTDAWNIDAFAGANRALSPSTIGFAYASVRRSLASDPAFSHWGARIGVGALKEVGWGLRPQITVEAGRQVNDAQFGVFGQTRRDWSVQAIASIYKRDWNIAGLAPSLKFSYLRNYSTIALYDQKRTRTEISLTKAF